MSQTVVVVSLPLPHHLKCITCGQKFNSKSEVTRHATKVHANKCFICEKTFGLKADLTRHVNSEHKCRICSNYYKDMLRHTALVHEGRDEYVEPGIQVMVKEDSSKHFKCEKCGKIFSRKDSCNAHILKVHGRFPMCPKCCKTFKSKRLALDPCTALNLIRKSAVSLHFRKK